MSEPSYTIPAAFSPGGLPTPVFSPGDGTPSMMLTHRGKGVIQHYWRDMCTKFGSSEGALADGIATHTKHLQGGKSPAVVVVLPAPCEPGEDHLVCWVGLPYLGVRRYFTLGV